MIRRSMIDIIKKGMTLRLTAPIRSPEMVLDTIRQMQHQYEESVHGGSRSYISVFQIFTKINIDTLGRMTLSLDDFV